MSDIEHGSKELTVCKNQLAHFRAAAKRLREQRGQLRTDFAIAESKVLVLTDELEHLKAENAKLREQLKESNDGRMRQADNLIEKYHRIARLETENAELRKLGGFMLRCISQYHDCADCLVNGEHCEISYIESDARELGIEVGA